MESKEIEGSYVVRLVRGEELLEALQKFCHEKNINERVDFGLG